MIRMGVSGWMFLLVPAYPGSPRQRAIKRLCVCVYINNACHNAVTMYKYRFTYHCKFNNCVLQKVRHPVIYSFFLDETKGRTRCWKTARHPANWKLNWISSTSVLKITLSVKNELKFCWSSQLHKYIDSRVLVTKTQKQIRIHITVLYFDSVCYNSSQ